MTYFNDCVIKFSHLPKEKRNKFGSVEILKKINEISKIYGVDLKFLLILLAINEVDPDNLAEYIEKKFNFDSKKAEIVKNELLKIVNILLTKTEQENKINPKQKIIDFFQEDIIRLLQEESDYQEALNQEIINMVELDNSIKYEDLIKAIFSNQQKLTTQTFFSNHERQHPTVSNWLADFIKQNGSQVFDNITLSEYLTNSDNAKNLNDIEKKLLRKLLTLYRNLKFFSAGSDNPLDDYFEIIPIDRSEEIDSNKVRSISGPPQTPEEKKIEELKQIQASEAKTDLEKMAIEEEIEEEKKIEDLKIMANKFKAGSLERRAIEEEIIRLNHE